MGVGRTGFATVSVGALVALLASGCGGGGGGADTAVAPAAAVAPAGGFVDPRQGGNKWLPLKPGTQWVREGTTLIGKRAVQHKVVSTVTDVMREINGVKAIAVLDEEIGGGVTVDKSIDWLAQDANGAIWWVGGITEEYKGGKSEGIDEAWADAKKGALRGMLVPADPAAQAGPWAMAKPAGEKGDQAAFVKISPKECVPFGCYNDVVVIEEGRNSDEVENKYYGLGVGQLRNEPKKSHDEDVEALANLTQLSAEGLTEASTEALRLDAAAVADQSETFGGVKAARAT